MSKEKLTYFLVLIGYLSYAQSSCPTITDPFNGDTDVPVDTEISWTPISGIDGYSVSIGTTPGGTEILNSRSAALVNSLLPVTGLPGNTEIFITISLYLDDGSFVTCPPESFFTENITTPPNCTTLSSPVNGSGNVRPGDNISWEYARAATGYRLAIGTTDNDFELLPETDVGNVLSYNPLDNFPTNTEIFVKIIPYNENGDAGQCTVQRFTTGDSNIDCEQFRTDLDIPSTIGICRGEEQVTVSTKVMADGFRWFQIHNDDTETLISEHDMVTISEPGVYRFEAYNTISLFGETTECLSSTEFLVSYSDVAVVDGIQTTRDAMGIRLEIQVSGPGDYEYTLGTSDGPYQDSTIFSSASTEDIWVYVRDKNGCGITEYLFVQTISEADFPKFFTPNGDGINDQWKFSPLFDNASSLQIIYIFDRYGTLVTQLTENSNGWDGTFNGRLLPSSTFWYKAIAKSGKQVKGFFTLKR